jgi:hypothetical protein
MFQNVLHDAAVSRMGSAGYLGAVSRSEDGLFLGASTLLVEGISDSPVLEVMACREVVVAWDYLGFISSMEQPFGGSYSMVLKEI